MPPFPMLDLQLIAELAGLGLCTGFLAGMLGIGGGMLLVPFMTIIFANRGLNADLSVKMAIATSMATILFTSLSSVRAHQQRGAVLWDVVVRLAPGIFIGACIASMGVFAILKGVWLAIFFAVFVLFSGTQMLLNRAPSPHRTLPGTAGQVGAGSVIGLLAGLVGAGGGFVSVPFMQWCNVPLTQAVATSAALGFPIALFNVAGYMISGHGTAGLPEGAIGYVHLPALGVIACASVLSAPLGVKVAHAVPAAHLKRVFALVLYALATYMIYHSLHA